MDRRKFLRGVAGMLGAGGSVVVASVIVGETPPERMPLGEIGAKKLNTGPRLPSPDEYSVREIVKQVTRNMLPSDGDLTIIWPPGCKAPNLVVPTFATLAQVELAVRAELAGINGPEIARAMFPFI